MYLRVSLILCCAVLAGSAAAAQNTHHHNSDITFNEDAEIEGSGNDGEVTQDLESSGSGFGPDDEDTPIDTTNRIIGSKPSIPDINKNFETPKNTVELTTEKPQAPVRTLDTGHEDNSDVKMDPKVGDTHTSFFAQPGILAAVIGGAVVGLLCAILVVMFIVYRMRKKDEGSYSLGEPKPSPNANAYNRGNEKEFYA